MSVEQYAGGLRTSHVKEVHITESEGAGATPKSPGEKSGCKIVAYADTLFCVTHARVTSNISINDFPYRVDWNKMELKCPQVVDIYNFEEAE